jgi:hypothetical protein
VSTANYIVFDEFIGDEQRAIKKPLRKVFDRFDLYERDKVLISSGKEGETEAGCWP